MKNTEKNLGTVKVRLTPENRDYPADIKNEIFGKEGVYAEIPISISTITPEERMKEVSTSVEKLSKKDINRILSSGLPNREEARALVSLYYTMQQHRIASAAQTREIKKSFEVSGDIDAEDLPEVGPIYPAIQFFSNEFKGIEMQIKKVLDAYTDNDPIAWTLKQVPGIGSVISSGIISQFDITRAWTAGAYWRYCGIDPSLPPRKKGEKLRYNQQLKTLIVFKLGESFVKVQNKDNDLYGWIYRLWKQEYNSRNEKGLFAETAANILATKNYKPDTEAYKSYSQGKLPKGHIHSMARRKPLMIFVSHLFDLQYQLYHHTKSPIPYAMAILGHTRRIPNYLVSIYEARYGKIQIDSETTGNSRLWTPEQSHLGITSDTLLIEDKD